MTVIGCLSRLTSQVPRRTAKPSYNLWKQQHINISTIYNQWIQSIKKKNHFESSHLLGDWCSPGSGRHPWQLAASRPTILLLIYYLPCNYCALFPFATWVWRAVLGPWTSSACTCPSVDVDSQTRNRRKRIRRCRKCSEPRCDEASSDRLMMIPSYLRNPNRVEINK